MSKRARTTGTCQSTQDEHEECPICFHEMRTIVRPFQCDGEIPHAICRSCDHRMFHGHDDRCPICRAPRSGDSISTNGARSHGIPVHERPGVETGAISLQDFFFPDDDNGGVHLTSVIARPGSNEVFSSLEELLRAASSERGISRAQIHLAPPAVAHAMRHLVEAASTGASATRELAAVTEAIGNDPSLSAAMDGLTNVADVPLGTFLHRVHGTLTVQAGRQVQISLARRRRLATARQR